MKKKFTRKIRKNKRTTQRRKNRSYKRMRGGVFELLPWWLTPLKTNLDVNATRVISESLPILGFSTPVVIMPTGDGLIEFQVACTEFIDMMQHTEQFRTFYDSNINSINDMFELLIPTEFTHLARYDDNILELFTQGKIPNTAVNIEDTLKKYLRESNKQHRESKKFNLLAFALFIMKIQKLHIFPFPLPPVSQEITDDNIKAITEYIINYTRPSSHSVTVLDTIQNYWQRIYDNIFSKNEISRTLTDDGKHSIINLCGVVSNPSKIILLQALLYYKMLPISGVAFREIYDKYIARTASAEEIRQLTIALILIATGIIKSPKP